MKPTRAQNSAHLWTESNLALLGRISDGKLAKQLGITTSEVYLKRSGMGIGPSRPFKPLQWTKKKTALLGKYPDEDLARRLGVLKRVVISKRHALGIPSFAEQTDRWHKWTPEETALLGTAMDPIIAEKLGLTAVVVTSKRQALKIPSFTKRNPLAKPRVDHREWPNAHIALLGKHPDAEVARRLGASRKTIISKRHELGIPSYAEQSLHWHTWTPVEISLLGTATDSAIAAKIGISVPVVTLKRRNLKIPSFTQRKPANRPRRSLYDWTKKEIALLGTLTDQEVAERLNLGTGTVRIKRISLGIPPCGGSKRIKT